MQVTKEELKVIQSLAKNDINNVLILIEGGLLENAADMLESLAKELRGIELK